MGTYDTVMAPCPQCGASAAFQSKSGGCNLETYALDEAPDDVLLGVNRHSPATCMKCGVCFGVDVAGPRRTLIARSAIWNTEDRAAATPEMEREGGKIVSDSDPARQIFALVNKNDEVIAVAVTSDEMWVIRRRLEQLCGLTDLRIVNHQLCGESAEKT